MNKMAKFTLLILCFGITTALFYKVGYKYHLASKPSAATVGVIETNSLEDLLKFNNSNSFSLFIFDFDNVLVEGKLDYGFDSWFGAMVKEFEKNNISRQEYIGKLLPIYEKIQASADVQPVEECAGLLIDKLRSSGHPVMILTVRSLCLIKHVFRQLESVNIDIKKDAIPEDGINTALTRIGAKYVDGILFCDGYKKGEALKLFLSGKPALNVKNIVFIDDKLKNLEAVQVTAQELGINFTGLRYGRTDQRSKAYVLDKNSQELAQKLVAEIKFATKQDFTFTGTHTAVSA